jgi:KaiC/GvpD/RAD55 family RecA-like ATPase
VITLFEPTYEGLPIIPVQTRRGQKNVIDELAKHGMDLDDAAIVLNEGHNCARSRRRKGVLEKCFDKGNKTIKVVVQKGL